MTGIINIQNKSKKITEIDIEGVIGVPEEWQFENNAQKTATYDRFKEQIDAIRSVSSAEVIVNIRSTGGNVNDAILIHDTLASLGKTVTTRCYGYVASAATIIAQAASEGKREISKNALYLIHKSVSTTEGNANNLNETIELLHKTDERIAEIYASRSGLPSESFKEIMNLNNGNGKWMSAKEAVKAGLADLIIESNPIRNLKKRWSEIIDLFIKNSMQEDEIPENISVKMGVNAENLNTLFIDEQAKQKRAEATATQTNPKEDPSYDETKMTENERAYYEDIQRFK